MPAPPRISAGPGSESISLSESICCGSKPARPRVQVIHFAPYFPPERIGGVGEFVARLHGALLAAGHDSTVATWGRAPAPGVRRIARGPFGCFFASALEAARAARCDLVHCQSGEALPLMLALALRRRRARVVANFHVGQRGMARALRPYTLEGRRFAPSLRERALGRLAAWAHASVDAAAIALADQVTAVCAATAQEALGAARAARARVIHAGLPPLPPPSARAPHVALLYAGVAGHRKRVNALPFVLARVRRQIPDARLRIVGFSLEREPGLSALFAELGVRDAVEALGPLRADELPAHYASADVLLLPSAYEGLPLVLLEAMQCGLPAVATRVSGHPEAIEDGRNGFLVDLDDPAQMAERCVALLRSSELRARLGAAARATIAERFDEQRQLRAFLDLCATPAAPERRP
jgi:glycosyltransferase involved in cell wall biosynthesis